MNQFLEQSNVDDESGSGFVYYATSDVSIKCVKNSKIGCGLQNDLYERYFKLLNNLSVKNLLFNPSCDSFCFKNCLEYFELQQKSSKLQLNNSIFNQPYVTFADFEEWDQDGINFGLRLLILDEEKLNFVHPIFSTTEFHTQEIQINLLVIPNKSDSAHFTLVLNLNSFLKSILYFNKGRQNSSFCQFCLIKNSNHKHVIAAHEK